MKFITTTVAVALFVAIGRATAGQGAEASVPVAPRLLSQTGLYADAATLKVDKRNRVFSPQYPLWSDGATKRRWVRLPEGSQINIADLANWELPVGTKFWKEFSFGGRKVETRFLWRTRRDKWVFASYAWNHAQTEAVLASESGIADITEIADGKRHSIPSVTECRSCHDSNRTETLGFNALQLSDDRDPNALHAEPLTGEMVTVKTLVTENLVTPQRPELIAAPPRIEAGSPVTRAALGYLSTNCGSCHNSKGSIASLGLDLRNTTGAAAECAAATATTVGKRGHWVVPEAPQESRIINPGHPESSSLIRRIKSRRPLSQMPPIGTVIVDTEAVEVLTSWVHGDLRCQGR
jgi:cytochrome c553/mono/diheme cytochrome c family protein